MRYGVCCSILCSVLQRVLCCLTGMFLSLGGFFGERYQGDSMLFFLHALNGV